MRHRLEAGFVVIILILLLTFMIPRFLSVQHRGLEKRIHQDLSALVSALQNYSLDYPQIGTATGFRDHVLHLFDNIRSPFDRAKKNGNIYMGGSYGQNVMVNRLGNVYELVLFLEDREYLIPGQTGQYYNRENTDAPMNYLSAREIRNGTSVHHIGFAALWPYIDPETQQRELAGDSKRLLDRQKFTQVPAPGQPYTTLLKQEYFFSPTNGMDSFGYVYCDTLGNRSYLSTR